MTGPSHPAGEPPPRISPGAAGDEPVEMELTTQVGEDLVAAVRRGEADRVGGDMAAVAEVLAALRRRAAAEPVPAMRPALRAQLEAPKVVALRASARSARRAVAAAAAVVLAVVGVGAAQNRLPSQLQDVVASTAELVGIDVPESSERDRSGPDEVGGDSTAPDRPDRPERPDRPDRADRPDRPGGEGPTPGGAAPAVPGSPDGPAIPATPPVPPEQTGHREPRSGPSQDGAAGTADPPGGPSGPSPAPSEDRRAGSSESDRTGRGQAATGALDGGRPPAEGTGWSSSPPQQGTARDRELGPGSRGPS